MVAQHRTPDHPSRPLSPEVERGLDTAMRALAKDPRVVDGELFRTALQAAAQDAKSRGLRAEELLVALKTIEQRVATELGPAGPEVSAFRTRLLHALLEAYYRL